jgi:Concanavalin A-like lectin/glucanases superfamily
VSGFLLALVPLAVLAVVALAGFAGCTQDYDDLVVLPDPDPYDEVILQKLGNGLVGYWRLGDPLGSQTAADQTGVSPGSYVDGQALPADVDSNPAPGTLTLASPGLIASDSAATSVAFDGGFVEVPLAPPQAVFSIEAWVHPDWPDGQSGFATVVAMSVGGADPRGFSLFKHWDAQEGARWAARVGGGVAGEALAIGAPVFVGLDAHLVATFDGSTLRLYVDGEEANQQAATYVPRGDRPLHIGVTETDALEIRQPFEGRIQEVALYEIELTKDDVQIHYTSNS